MKNAPVLIAAVLAILLLPILAVAAIAGAIIPAATSATSCADVVAASSGVWRSPLLGQYSVSSGFGMRYHPVLHVTKLHTGIDLVASTGEKTVVAAADGTVKVAGFNQAYGNQVVIENGQDIATRYGHMASPSPTAVGQEIAAGTKLGTQGATGYVTGAHLHFEIIKNGTPIDPKPFLADHGAPLNGGVESGAASDAVTRVVVAAPAKDAGSIVATRTDGKTVRLNAEQLSNAAVIVRVGQEVGAGSRGVVVALMAALQESTLRNLSYGDRDSLGLFQQRAGWGSAQQRQQTEYAARAYFGGPTGPNHSSPPGLLDRPGWKIMRLGQAAQAVQVSAFPAAYDPWEPVARTIVDSGSVSGDAVDCSAGGSAYGHLNVTTWNICLEFCGGGKLRPWQDRIPLIARSIRQAKPDVISLQEAGHRDTRTAAMVDALAPTYRLAVYKRSKMILYDSTKLSVKDDTGHPLGSAQWVIEGKGGVAQTFRDRRTGALVVLSSLHPVDGSDDARRLRYITRAHRIVVALQRARAGSVIVYAGDLNSYIPGSGDKRDVARFFTGRGYTTSEQVASQRDGQQYRSYNGGHPPRRGPRIDHVIVDPRTVNVNSWRQILSADPDDPESDHNLIAVDLALAAPAPAEPTAAGRP
ncbi:peptidoglycan DD-metalloendopeptidase family protein [Aeromicrobium sp.]|uniref:peptidoglycan DD-metalloendopeptidase family protein n=1 Tax=Aeromicrobium sp. TaxID=1871063 RepID=UPI0019A69879|nr:peptidoglycan DD-metalloendopeptidase family protein [Aeromicrobium sp.]MBC7633261.1 peptidoglycan DD-metalloendopeptidase family protein [Aeromicrobium sp.]